MSIFFKAEKQVREQIEAYLAQVDACMAAFRDAVIGWLDEDPDAPPPQRIHELESGADDLRRDIEMTLYGRALLPESRGDLLGLLETLDKIPNVAETVVWMIETERLKAPDWIHDDLRELVTLNWQAYALLRKAVDALFQNPRQTPYVVKEVDVKESESDRLERRMIRALFDSDLDKGDKILLKDLVVIIGDISDRAENAADRIGIIAIKRRI